MIATRIAPIEATLTEYGRADESREILGALQFLTSDPAHMEIGVVPTVSVNSVIETINRIVSESTTVVDARNSEYIGHRNGPAGCVYHGTVSLRNRIDLSEEFVEYTALMRALGVGSNDDDLITGYHFENRIASSPAFSPMYWFLTAVSMFEGAKCGSLDNGCYVENHIPFVVIHDNTYTSEPGARIMNINIETGEADWVKPADDEIGPADYDFDFESDEVVDDAGEQLSFDEWLDEEEGKDFFCDVCDEHCTSEDRTVTIGGVSGHADCMITRKH